MNKQKAKELLISDKASERNTKKAEAKIEQIYGEFKEDLKFMSMFFPKLLKEFDASEEELSAEMYFTGTKKGDLFLHEQYKRIIGDY